ALQICGNSPAAQDAVQDTFIAAYTHLQSLRNPDFFYSWLRSILTNTCYQLIRKEKYSDLNEQIEKKDHCIQQSIDEHFDKISNHQRLFEALRLLSVELRSCVVLRYFSRFNRYDEIAKLLDIPVGTVRSRLAAAREKLKVLYSTYEDPGDAALKEASEWSAYYQSQWDNIYHDVQTRNEIINHFHPSLNIRFTSGKSGKGRLILEREIEDDLSFGSRLKVTEVFSSGNLSVLECTNFNHQDFPDRCPPATTLILLRNKNKVESLQIFDSPRIKDIPDLNK
ncbi:MAG: RNA polymerase sigma factor, partial [Saprospiraceae bacterium]